MPPIQPIQPIPPLSLGRLTSTAVAERDAAFRPYPKSSDTMVNQSTSSTVFEAPTNAIFGHRYTKYCETDS
jgi:hypothetical protein